MQFTLELFSNFVNSSNDKPARGLSLDEFSIFVFQWNKYNKRFQGTKGLDSITQ